MGKVLDAHRERKKMKIENKHERKMTKLESGQTNKGVRLSRSEVKKERQSGKTERSMYKNARMAEGFKYGIDSTPGSVFKNLFNNAAGVVSSIYGNGSYNPNSNQSYYNSPFNPAPVHNPGAELPYQYEVDGVKGGFAVESYSNDNSEAFSIVGFLRDNWLMIFVAGGLYYAWKKFF